METIQSLIYQNGRYDDKYGICKSDETKINKIIDLIENSRINEPTPGDRIICVGPTARHEFGHMERHNYSNFNVICVKPMTSFAFVRNGKVEFDTSGGYWLGSEDLDCVEKGEQYLKQFCTWGSVGACGGGAVNFMALVNSWIVYSEKIY